MSPPTPRYPIYIISKGRSDACLTADFLIRDGVDFSLVVEPQETELYAARYGAERIYTLPFANLGLGSIPARNWVWEHSKAAGDERHWILDDNMRYVKRLYRGKRLNCDSHYAFSAVEDFIDRYTNVAIGGIAYQMFVPDNTSVPYYLNVHVYSCLLIRNDLPNRWRGRYNEDTDLCLQVLSDGWCTVLVNAFTIDKVWTGQMKGGNTDELYQGDGRLKMARSLERAWPHVVSVSRRFQRPQHVIRGAWKGFDTPLQRRADVDFDALPAVDEYGMELVQVADEIKSPFIQKLLDENMQRVMSES